MKIIFLSLVINFSLVLTAYAEDHFAYPVMMKTTSGGTAYVDATLAGTVTASFLVDTGSSMLVVNRKTFKALKQHRAIQFSHEAAARLANGKLHRVDIYIVHQFRIGNDCDIGRVDIAVIEKGNNILGMNALKRVAPFAMSVNPPTLMLSDCSDTLTVNLTAL